MQDKGKDKATAQDLVLIQSCLRAFFRLTKDDIGIRMQILQGIKPEEWEEEMARLEDILSNMIEDTVGSHDVPLNK